MNASWASRAASAGWFTSSYSNELNACVQVRHVGGHVQVADSKDRGRGPVITVTAADWGAFVAAVLGGGLRPDAALTVHASADGGRVVTASTGAELRYTAVEWAAFLAGAADGEFDRPGAA